MKKCPKCQRPAMSKASPRCNYCGAAMEEGGLDWDAAQEKARADHIKSSTTAVPFVPPLNKAQRARSMEMLQSVGAANMREAVGQIAKGLAFDYSEELLKQRTTCHCGSQADLAVSVEWKYGKVVEREFNGINAVALFAGVLSWQENTMSFLFTTHHPICFACSRKTFLLKGAIERMAEPIPREIQLAKVHLNPHPSRLSPEE